MTLALSKSHRMRAHFKAPGALARMRRFNKGFIRPARFSVSTRAATAQAVILPDMRPAPDDFAPREELSRLIEISKTKTDTVMITDTEGIIQFVNAAFEEATGYSLNEAVGQPASAIKPDFHDPDFYSRMRETLRAGNDFRMIFSNRNKNGDIFHEDTHIRPFIDRFGVITHFVATSRGLSEPLRLTLQRLEREAYYDALTGLPNRNLFMDRLRQSFSRASRRGEKFFLVYIDLDNFKAINDAYGHAAGDTVLRATANCLSASVRDEDTVARLGGDEFALILLNVHRREDIELVSNKILLSLANGARFENRHIPVRASLGASIYPDDGDSSDTLLKLADLAMYSAKSAGGHCFHFFEDREQVRW